MSRRNLFYQVFFLVVGMAFVFFASTAAVGEQIEHPCHPGPPGPGNPPCPPTATPDASEPSLPGSAVVGFRLSNQTDEMITLRLGDPVAYVLNVPAQSETVYTIARNVYPFALDSCGTVTTGYMDLTVYTFYVAAPCPTQELVRVTVVNQSSWSQEVMMYGPSSYVFAIGAGETRVLTISKGDYTVTYSGCLPASRTTTFEARAGRVLKLTCQ